MWPEQLRDGKGSQGHQRSNKSCPLSSGRPLLEQGSELGRDREAEGHCGRRQEPLSPRSREFGGLRVRFRPILPPRAHRAAAHSHLLMRDTQLSAWLRSGELPRLFRFSPSLTRDCSTVLQEAGEGRQGFSEGTAAHGETREGSSKASSSPERVKMLGVPTGDASPAQGSVRPHAQPGTVSWPDTGTDEGVGLCQAVRAQEQLTQPSY